MSSWTPTETGSPAPASKTSPSRQIRFHRQLTEKADPETGTGPRYIVRQESPDSVTWSPRQTVFHPMGERWPEVESMKVIRYEGVCLRLPSMLDNYVRGDVEQHLIISRDGYRWDYPFPGEAFMPQGEEGSWDDRIIWWPSMIVHGEKMLFCYTGARYNHGSKKVDGFRREDCDVIRGDALAHRVTWKGRSIASLRGKAVRLRFLFRDATIWAFQVADTAKSVR